MMMMNKKKIYKLEKKIIYNFKLLKHLKIKIKTQINKKIILKKNNKKMKTDKNSQNQKPKEQPKQETPQPEKPKTEREKSYSPEDLNKLSQRRQQRLKNEKISEKENQKLYEEILEEAKKNNFRIKPKKEDSIPESTNLKISEKKAQTILEEGGMLDAYKYLIVQLCKNGLPTGNLFEYSAYVIKNYEKKWKEKKVK